ncbi:MAG: hypothetical protein QOG03_841 [Actinomycetota bacterium]|jgi:long-chain acyl-CoA synthetase|nr:hypothetical protein [Actinomycetota bacterium]
MGIRQGGSDLSIANGVREFARATPGATAVIDGDRSLTYAALDERASRLANTLLSSGLSAGQRVAVLAGNRLEYCEIACGLAKAGLPMVPLNPRLTASEAGFIIEHSGASALILDDGLAAAAAPSTEAGAFKLVLSIDGTTLGLDYEETLAASGAADPRADLAETEPFCIAYTSGTTGDPKGVMISHRSRSLTFYGAALEWGLGPGRRTIAVAPMYHGAGFAFGYAAVHVGGTVSMLRAWDPEAFLARIATDRPHSVFLVPAHAQMLRALGEDALATADLAGLETLYFNAAALPQPLKEWVLASAPGVGVHELYGSTEAGIVTDLRPSDIARKVSCVGVPWFMTELRVIDDDGNVVEGEGTGELFSRSPFLMNGYHDNPDATAACTTDDGFLTAGDVVRVDDEGFVHIIDRKKDMIISGGTNVYPREVEDVLRRHPSVVDVGVVGATSETWGEEVAAFVVLAAGTDLDEASLDAHCRQSLAGFKVPRRYRAVDALPRNAAGKVLKTDLRTQLQDAG